MSKRSDFEKAAQGKEISFAHELLIFMRENKKWWLLPIFLILGVVALFALCSTSGAAPFIYTLF